MKAIYIVKPRQVEIRDIADVRPAPGEALLKPLFGGICGSDLGSYRGDLAYVSYPRIPGHEFSAEVVEIGDNPQRLKPGDLVVCNPYFNCGRCYSCQRGLLNACMQNQTMGVQREGAFAEYITMPIERLIPGQGLGARTLALIEPYCIGHHGIERARVQAGDRVLVLGAGTIGVMAAIAAKARGAEVYISDIEQQKLDMAMGFGLAGSILNRSKEAFDGEVSRITDGNGFDVTVEAVGLPNTLQNCLDAAAFGGRVSVIGVGKKRIDLDFTILQRKELNIFGSRNALSADFISAIALVCEGKLDLDPVVSHVYPWLEAARAFADFDQAAGSMLKVLLEF